MIKRINLKCGFWNACHGVDVLQWIEDGAVEMVGQVNPSDFVVFKSKVKLVAIGV